MIEEAPRGAARRFFFRLNGMSRMDWEMVCHIALWATAPPVAYSVMSSNPWIPPPLAIFCFFGGMLLAVCMIVPAAATGLSKMFRSRRYAEWVARPRPAGERE